MTVRAAWVWMPLAIVGAALLLAILHGPLAANDSPTIWDFEGEDPLAGWGPTITKFELAPGEGSADSNAIAITLTSEMLGHETMARLERDVTIAPGHTYTYGGEYVSQIGNVHWGRLQIELFDANGTRLHRVTNLQAPPPWRWSDPFDAPCEAVMGQYRVQVFGDIGSTAFVDNLYLKESAAWTTCPTPAPTYTSTPSPTPTPTASPTPTSPPTSTPIATLAPVATPTPSSTSTSTRTATPTLTHSSTPDTTAIATPSPADTRTPSPTPTPPAPSTSTATATANPTSASTPTPVENVAPVALDFGLRNAGFEDGADGQPSAWKTVGGLLMQAGTPARNGSWSGAFFSSTASTKWAYQAVAVTPASWYQYDAFIYHNDPWVASALLRISWYASADGSGSAVATIDSRTALASSEPGFRSLSTGPVMAPPGVHSAKLRVLIRPRDATNAVIYIDDVSFASATIPATPTSPGPAASATPPATTLPPITPPPPATPTIATPIAATSTAPPPTTTAARVDTFTPPPAATFTPPPTPALTATATVLAQHSEPSRALANAGFEEASGDVPAAWRTYGGLLTQTASPARSGGAAGAFFSSSARTKWVFQTVAVDATTWYQFDAFVYHGHVSVESALLRISWYASTDASGSALASVDSTALLTTPESAYRPLSTGAVQSPPGVHSAKLRVLMRPRDGTSALIYIDDASFRRVAEPTFTPLQQDIEPPAAPRVASSAQTSASAVYEPLAVARPQPVLAPMPAPVIRRHSLRTPDQLATPPSKSDGPLWPWALFGGATGAGVVGWVSYLAQRRRGVPG